MRTARSAVAQLLAGVVAGSVILCGTTPAAAGAKPGKDVCANKLAPQDLESGKGAYVTPLTEAVVAAVSSYKKAHDLFAADRPTAAQLAQSAAHQARKEEMFGKGEIKGAAVSCAGFSTSASGQISWMYHYGQVTNYFCGPAVVSMFSATVPGSSPYNLDQWAAAGYMGTTTNGTSWSMETNGLNHFVGIPDFGWAFYGMSWLSDPPTQQQQTTFYNNLVSDVGVSSPIAGLAWEVPYGPHLVGHPVSQEIGHWIEIGGYNTSPSQVWYADPATTVWSSVPSYSWFDMYTMEVILGGAGYIW
jgi:hypothetical protein